MLKLISARSTPPRSEQCFEFSAVEHRADLLQHPGKPQSFMVSTSDSLSREKLG